MKGACRACTEIIFNNKPNKNRDINSSYASWLWEHQVEYKSLQKIKTVVGEYLCGGLPFQYGLKNTDGISTFGFQLLSSALHRDGLKKISGATGIEWYTDFVSGY